MVSIAGERADQLAELTCDRRAARYAEIAEWWSSVDAGEWFGKGYRSPSAWIAAATREPARFSGCEVPAEMCDARHALHWADDGETEARNLVLLCWFHHHVMHEQHFSLEPLGAGHFVLRSPNGDWHLFSPPRLDILTRPDQLSLTPI